VPSFTRLLCLLLLLPLLCTGPAQAQDAAGGEPDPAAADRARIEALIATLEDDQQRQEFLDRLRLLLEVQETAEAAEERLSLGDRMLGQLAQQFEAVGEAIDAVLSTPDSIGDMTAWLEADVSTETGRKRWQDILRAGGISIGAAILAFFAVAIPLRRVRARLGTPARTALGRTVRRLGAFLLDVAPVLAFAAAGSAALAAIEKGMVARMMTSDLLSVLTISLAARTLVRVLTRPREPSLRLLRISDGAARDINRCLITIIVVMTAAYAITETLPMIGMPWSARRAVLTLAALVSAVMLIRACIRFRKPIRAAIYRSASRGTILGDFLTWFAGVWHIAGVALVAVLLVAYIVGGDGLFLLLVGRLFWSAVGIALCYLLWRLFIGWLERMQRRSRKPDADADLMHESGGMLMRLFARVALAALAVALLIHIWLFDVIEWLGNDAGRDLVEVIITVAIILALAYAANRAIFTVIQRIQNSSRAGTATQRRRRLETLLPLLRSASAVIIIAISLLIVLSEIGLDIAPLLASAGVVGIAIGFGAQSLVKDVITGLFFLVEDAFGVGDTVTLAGYSGVVEEMSIRSIKLRDFSGALHVIPFGTVTAATNMTRDFSYAVFEVNVAQGTSIDAVVDAMREVDQELRADRRLSSNVLEPIEVVGLDKAGDSGSVIRARVKTRPARQWDVMRTYHRHLRRKFEEHGIAVPESQKVMQVVQPQPGDPTQPPQPAGIDPLTGEMTASQTPPKPA
jgi:small-conductance mechanosensitive channel